MVDETSEIAVRLSNFVASKVVPANLRKSIGKKKATPLARKFMHINVHHVIMFHVCIGHVCKAFKTWLQEQEVQSNSDFDDDEDEEMERDQRGTRKAVRSDEPDHQEGDLADESADSLHSQVSHHSVASSQFSSPESPLPVPRASSSSRSSRRSILANPTPSVPAAHVTPQSSRQLVHKRPRSSSSANSQSSGSRRRGGSKKKKAKVSGKSKQRLQPLQGT